MLCHSLTTRNFKVNKVVEDDKGEVATSTEASFQSSISTNSIVNKDIDNDLAQSCSQTTPPCPELKKTLETNSQGPVTKQGKNPHTNNVIKDDKSWSEYDKFKRRLIRAVARLLLENKKPEEEVWKELKKETSCDCKLLWTRMSALTIKKLKRLFIANDEIDKITKIAQLSVTDWLLFDLVLVHEDVDVIGQEINTENKTEPTILKELFDLVLKYRIEYLSGDVLTAAWYKLTADYNSQGRKCSPMLLQRRWYQMKEQVRNTFYNFWFTYGGNHRKLENADKHKPTDLQMAIVNEFMFIVTEPFKIWEDLINQKRVSLYSDFQHRWGRWGQSHMKEISENFDNSCNKIFLNERLLQLSKKKTSHSENEPDIEVIEPHVETIDVDSDDDDSNDNEDSRDSVKLVNDDENSNKDAVESENADNNDGRSSKVSVKIEAVYDLCDEDEVNAFESTRIPLEDKSIEEISKKNEDINEKESPDVTQDTSFGVESTTVAEQTNLNTFKIQGNEDIICEDNVGDLNPVEEENGIVVTKKVYVDSAITVKTDNFEVMPKITNITSTAQIPVAVDNDDDVPEEINNISEMISNNIAKKKHDIVLPNIPNLRNKIEVGEQIFNDVLSNDLQLMEGIELEDDGIEYVDEDENIKDLHFENEEETIQQDKDNETPKIDLKLLLDPVVFTKKLDNMDVFRFIDFITVKDKRVLENAVTESKPFDKKSVNMEDISEERRKSKESDCCSETGSDCNDNDTEEEGVDLTSWLFRKLKSPSYNPIKLCKNPDFNTRLKRLTASFFSSQRNRLLLRECKPLTIDLHKEFESKLINNTLYLKKSYSPETKPTVQLKAVEKTVFPFKLPGQTLTCIKALERTKSGPSALINLPAPKEDSVTEIHDIERNKVINLPDINQIRRSNEKLLIAEVTPIQVSNVLHKAPVILVKRNNKNIEISQNDKTLEGEESANAPINIEPSSITPAVKKNDDVIPIPNLEERAEIIGVFNDANSKKLNKYYKKKLAKKPTKYTYRPRPVSVTWLPRNLPEPNEIPTDRLLARDTVERIIRVCKGTFKSIPSKIKIKRLKKKCGVEKEPNKRLFNDSNKKIVDDNTDKNKSVETDQPVLMESDISVNNKKNPKSKKNTVKDYNASRKYKSCCWARHKLDYWDNKIKRLKMAHECPQPKCYCCCRMEYCTRLKENNRLKSTPSFNLISDDESEQNSGLVDSQKGQTSKVQKTTNKVSIGINTDYNKDFEENYATNLGSMNLNIAITTENLSSSLLLDSTNKGTNNATQTDSFNMVESTSVLESTDVSFNTEQGGPIISDVRSVPKAKLPNSSVNKPKCKTNIRCYSAQSNTSKEQNVCNKQKLPLHESTVGENILKVNNKVIFLDSKIKNNLSKNPICLGKNKILLYSLTQLSKANMIDVTDMVANCRNSVNNYVSLDQNQSDLPILIPNGVHLALLPNQELVVTIDPGVELDPNQVATLPSIIAAVQHQLVAIGAINKESVTKINPPKIVDVIQLSDDENSPENKVTNQMQENNKVPTEADVTIQNFENRTSFNEINKTNASFTVKKSLDITKHMQEETVTKNSDITSDTLVDNNENKSIGAKMTPEPEMKSKIDGQDHINDGMVGSNVEITDTTDNSTDSLNMIDTSKKTILSDLMQMSGISLEDTTVPNIENPNISPPLVQVQNANIDTSNNKTNISSDNPLINYPFVYTALLKCPDLNVVSSFEELKHTYENGGYFYKMDVETGIIVPINVCIKKQLQSKKLKVATMPKTIIDLTEDEKQDKQQISNEKSNIKSTVEENIVLKPVKPVKLFKAVHPSLLRKPNIIRRVKIFKRSKPQQVETVTKRVGEVNVGNSESDDDDEPLALMVKRKKIGKGSSQVGKSEETRLDEVTTDTAEANLEAVSRDESILTITQEIDNRSQRVEPVFLNNDDSMDEDCILGV